jgi:hypothetical protein
MRPPACYITNRYAHQCRAQRIVLLGRLQVHSAPVPANMRCYLYGVTVQSIRIVRYVLTSIPKVKTYLVQGMSDSWRYFSGLQLHQVPNSDLP